MTDNSIKMESNILIDHTVIEFLDVNKTFINAKYKSKITALQDINFVTHSAILANVVNWSLLSDTCRLAFPASNVLNNKISIRNKQH